jgi:hypothetical protein
MKEQPVPRQRSEIKVAIENMTVFGIHTAMKICISEVCKYRKITERFLDQRRI